VDTHGRTHHAAVIDQQGRLLGDREFAADSSGYQQLHSWLRRHGRLDLVGVEGTGSYGAGLTRHLLDHGVKVVEVDRPDRRLRRQRGKSDPIDAEAAARAVLAGTATAPAKARHGIVETIRALRAARSGAIKARTAAVNQLKGLLVTAPAALREALDGQATAGLVAACARLRPDETALAEPVHGLKAALRAVAQRVQQLDQELILADERLARLVGRAAPRLLKLHAIGGPQNCRCRPTWSNTASMGSRSSGLVPGLRSAATRSAASAAASSGPPADPGPPASTGPGGHGPGGPPTTTG
jgi:transposase